MAHPDLNLLVTLDALLDTGSVTAAARRLGLSASAMSRALARLREVTGDPLLVRAGRGLVPTPRALELRQEVSSLVQRANAALSPSPDVDLSTVERTFTIRASEGFAEGFGGAIVARAAREAPSVRLRFLPKAERESSALRDATVDLEVGLVRATPAPELRTALLFRDHFVGVVSPQNPMSQKPLTLEDYLAAQHVLVSRSGSGHAPVDGALAAQGHARKAGATAGGFGAALGLARGTNLAATVPERFTDALRHDLIAFPLPFEVDPIPVALVWHPRMDTDPCHCWLRSLMRDICG
ncbi:DNA-binding transcriptional regulator, LysR family [Palleronia marisminoris]|uniref:Nodulation protein D 2 n=1 Tax=Palleronia marisminoris TaxID=315423 RepID=A0A1Y5TF29_9RHOB|nr:LysR family transcriptional regulator [Palleronia marisminoris]SFH36912.1 DNA-binding transcriptional regulator, LysR family [Palleronia marisminoris]SLN62350.1 Nodulation protein D 2 [Palleronia marisminoris]